MHVLFASLLCVYVVGVVYYSVLVTRIERVRHDLIFAKLCLWQYPFIVLVSCFWPLLTVFRGVREVWDELSR